jgi:hypothetical protein
MSRDDDRPSTNEYAAEAAARVDAYLARLGERGEITAFSTGSRLFSYPNGVTCALDVQGQGPFRARDGERHGMAAERWRALRGVRNRVLVLVVEVRGEERVLLTQWLDVLDAVGDPFVLPGGNVVWRRDALSLDGFPRRSSRQRLPPIGEAERVLLEEHLRARRRERGR